MIRLLAAFMLLVLASTAGAFQPRTGTWWNPNESGTAYEIEVQNGVLVVTIYSYQPGGAPQWYLSAGPLTNSQHAFAGTLDKYVGGQCISCPYTGRPVLAGNEGTISIAFASEMSASVTLPGGRTTQIQPFNFAIGDPPSGLIGEWIFVYDIGTSTFAERFDLTTLLNQSTPNGNGVVGDPVRIGICELQISGTLAGTVICGRGDAQGNVLSAYMFRFGLDETYDGYTVSPPNASGRLYPMKGFKVQSKGGISRHMAVPTGAESVVSFQANFETLVDTLSRASPTP